MVMTYDGALVMPSSYAVMEQEEMTYVEGGIAVPNWLVSGATNLAISALFGGVGAFAGKVAAGYFAKAAARKMFAEQLSKQLFAKGVASKAVSVICGYLPSALTLIGAFVDPGKSFAEFLDGRDKKPNNGYFDL
ncbi:MAG: hypothetical protein UHN47_17595 [Lachnospiraceae bacterium]|nr:hypothetical protein [Lachnospiraceae bacterium]